MTLDDLVKKYYTAKIVEVIKKEDVCNYVLNHPRLPACQSAFLKNMKLTEFKIGSKLKQENIKKLAEDFGMIFAKVVLDQKRKDIVSLSEKIRQEREEQKFADMMAKVDPNNPEYADGSSESL